MPVTPRPMTDPDDVERALLDLKACTTDAQFAHWARAHGEAICLGFRAMGSESAIEWFGAHAADFA